MGALVKVADLPTPNLSPSTRRDVAVLAAYAVKERLDYQAALELFFKHMAPQVLRGIEMMAQCSAGLKHKEAKAKFECIMMKAYIEEAAGNVSEAAKLCGQDRSAFSRKIREAGLLEHAQKIRSENKVWEIYEDG
jgi:DNA-binding NtrC family response regulator